MVGKQLAFLEFQWFYFSNRMALSCLIIKVLLWKGFALPCDNIFLSVLLFQSLCLSNAPCSVPSHMETAATPWIFPDGSSKAEFTECNMLGLLQCHPGNQESSHCHRIMLYSSVLLMPGSFGIKWSHSFPWIQ
ncbi:hypothetical protein CK203_063334 [Vitis vinifera]|uniref:Uncharacterized protein n=1 Tax=Vitis vinifera TaxID=29760 RepID=A0A438FPC2_VITVI|nr:hypothetical protein CK203_063334 [Vitis vinifera]